MRGLRRTLTAARRRRFRLCFLGKSQKVPVREETNTLVVQETGSDVFSGAGRVAVSGIMAAQEAGPDVFSGTMLLDYTGVAGTMSAQEAGSDTLSATGAVTVSGSMAVQESGSDTMAGAGAMAISGAMAAQETGADAMSATGSVAVSGTMAAQESGADTFSGTGTVEDQGTAPTGLAVVGAQQDDGSVPLTISDPSEDAPDCTVVFVPAGEAQPSTAQVRAGQKSDGTAAPVSGAFSVTASSPNATLSGLPDVDGTFDVHVVLGDAQGNYSATPQDAGPVTLDFDPAAFVDADWSVATGAAGALNVTIAQLPANKGLTITDVEYELDASGTWVSSGGTGDFSITGLTESQSYAVRLRAVNSNGAGAAGNSESASAGASGATGATTTFLHQHMDSGFGVTRTYNNGVNANIPADLDGVRIVIVISLRENGTLSGAPVVGGTTATLREEESTWQKAYVYDAVGGTANDDIVVTLGASEAAFISIYSTTGQYLGGATDNNSGGAASPYTADLSLNTTAQQAVVGALGGTGITSAAYTGLTQRGALASVGGRQHVHFDTLSVAGGTPETLEATLSGGGSIFCQACLALYG